MIPELQAEAHNVAEHALIGSTPQLAEASKRSCREGQGPAVGMVRQQGPPAAHIGHTTCSQPMANSGDGQHPQPPARARKARTDSQRLPQHVHACVAVLQEVSSSRRQILCLGLSQSRACSQGASRRSGSAWTCSNWINTAKLQGRGSQRALSAGCLEPVSTAAAPAACRLSPEAWRSRSASASAALPSLARAPTPAVMAGASRSRLGSACSAWKARTCRTRHAPSPQPQPCAAQGTGQPCTEAILPTPNRAWLWVPDEMQCWPRGPPRGRAGGDAPHLWGGPCGSGPSPASCTRAQTAQGRPSAAGETALEWRWA